jgi:2-polyprenyl-3-methyl-5-hydroxy-6-metoxy-1,4-benzoquinol methylase
MTAWPVVRSVPRNEAPPDGGADGGRTVASPGELEDIDCPNGCARDDEPVLVGRDRLHGLPGEFRVVRCRACGLQRTNPRPRPEAMGQYYPPDYGPHLGTVVRPRAGAAAAGGWVAALRRLHGAIFRYRDHALPRLAPGNLLEIGCASGAFLHEMAGRGWRVQGIEFSPEAVANARAAGLEVQAGAVEQATAPDQPLDLVVGWMVLEHLHRPTEVLRKLADWSRPGAWLALSVPNARSKDFAWLGDFAYGVQLPTHLYHFTPDTLEAMLERCGWRVERVLHQRTLGSWIGGLALRLEAGAGPRWLARYLRAVTARPRLSGKLLYPLACLLAAIGQTGRMTVWARRAEAAPATEPNTGGAAA